MTKPLFDPKAFGVEIARKRDAEKWTLRGLAELVGVAPSTIHRIEKGASTDVESFLRLSAWLERPHRVPKLCKQCNGTGVLP